MIPFIGGICGSIGLIILPGANALRLCWIPLIVDPGSGLLLAGIVIDKIKNAWRYK